MKTLQALVPLKSPAQAKTRLAGALTREESAALALHMAEDVLGALSGSGCFHGIGLLAGDEYADLAQRFGARLHPDTPGRTWSQDLSLIACDLAAHHVHTLLVVPGDLPLITAPQVRRLMSMHRTGVTLCPAERDGGTNAIVLTPPDVLGFAFGTDSAQRHLDTARARGVPVQRVELPAFARDVDTLADLQWLCEHAVPGATQDYLARSGIRARLHQAATEPA